MMEARDYQDRSGNRPHGAAGMLELQDFSGMFERNPQSQVIVDKDLVILLVNEAFCTFVGYSRDRLIGMKFSDFKTRNMIKYIKDTGESLADAISLKRDTEGETTFETPSGLHVMVRSNHPFLDDKGQVRYVYVTYNEVTKIVRNQNYMAHEIDELTRIYSLMAKGDLTPRYEITKPDDETRETYNQLIKLRDAVRGIIGNLQVNIRDVNKRMMNLMESAETANRSLAEATKGVQQVAQNAGKVSGNADRSADGVEQISKAMQDMSATVEEITSTIESVSSLSRETNELSKKGAELAGQAEHSMDAISQSSQKVYEIVADVEKQMGEISKIVVLIRELANQTNLLALNAAIEAARAGDAGRGFAVVATEVKSLAQESRNSAERIEEMINTLTKSTQNASMAMGEAKGTVEQGAKMVTETLVSFNQIAAAVDKVAKSAGDVSAASEEQAATTEEVTASVHEVATLVEQTSKEVSDAAAAIEESSAAMDEISSMVNAVNTVAAEALEANRKFRVD